MPINPGEQVRAGPFNADKQESSRRLTLMRIIWCQLYTTYRTSAGSCKIRSSTGRHGIADIAPMTGGGSRRPCSDIPSGSSTGDGGAEFYEPGTNTTTTSKINGGLVQPPTCRTLRETTSHQQLPPGVPWS